LRQRNSVKLCVRDICFWLVWSLWYR